MPLPTPNLDDLRFQSHLVDEARKRIIRYCPEWTEYNVSDPGVTLIELFAWMTELLTYRLNKVPEKNYTSFLNLLGFQRLPASSARTDLTFWLSIPLPISEDNLQDVVVPAGQEVRTQGDQAEEIVFSTNKELRITPPILTQLIKESQPNRNYLSRLGVEDFYPFNRQRPQKGDTFYLGFNAEKDLSGHILELTFACEATKGEGIRREDPPWVWECSTGNDQWDEVPLSKFRGEKDTTGGFNNPNGSLTLYLPLEAKPDQFFGRDGYWVRCRLEQRDPSQGMYEQSPVVLSITANTLGATVPAAHAQVVQREFLGLSSGEPAQTFTLENAPVLALAEDETLLVEEFQNGEYVEVPWQHVTDFAFSKRFDRHFSLDSASGQLQLGPAVRQSDGVVKQYGRVPESGREIYFSRYRYGGGVRGNLPPNSLQIMSSSVAYVARVNNLERAIGGQDQENMQEVQLRAQRELQAQKRAVTALDYEQFVKRYSLSVARVKCMVPSPESGRQETGAIQVLVIPAVAQALQSGDLSSLGLSAEFVQSLSDYLDQYRLLTTIVQIAEPKYVGVKLNIQVVISDYSNPDVVMARVNHAVRNLINPLPPFTDEPEIVSLLEPGWEGWPWGRNLYTAEIYALIQRIPGVTYALDVGVSYRNIRPAREKRQDTPPPLTTLEEKALWISSDTLLCSLDHEITFQTLSDFESQKEL